jgi:hypothetical protein
MRTDGILYWEDRQVWTSGNLTNLNQLSNGPGYITGISFANVSSKPTTIAGYGITDAITTANIGSQSVSYADYTNRTFRGVIEDTRAAQRTPNDYDDYRVSWEFTDKITGISDWHTVMTMQGWHNAYAAWQIIGPSGTSAHENWYLRSGNNTTWNTLRKIWHSGNFTDNSANWNTAYTWGNHAGLYVASSGGTLSGQVTLSNYANGGLSVGSTGIVRVEPSYQNISLGESYASNLREHYFRNGYTVSPTDTGYKYAKLIQQNLLNEASLVLIPQAIKPGLVGLNTPTNVDMTFTRTGDTATRVGPNGLIEKVRTNLISYSEQFNYWGDNAGATVSANTAANPLDGLMTADTLSVAISNYSGLYIITYGGSANYTLSIYAKKGTKDFLYLVDAAGSASVVWFNLAAGTIGTVNAGYTATMTSVGNGWYRCSLRKDTPSIFTYFQFGLSDTDGSSIPTSAGTAYIYGAQAEISDFGATAYIPTTTTAVSVGPIANIARIDYSGGGCGKLLLEPQRTNKQTYSEAISTTNYTTTAVTVVANYAISPDGFQNADKIIPTTNDTNHEVRTNLATLSGYDVISCFVKAEGYSYVQLVSWANPLNYVNFDLTDGTVGTVSTATVYGIKAHGNGWYRIWANVQASGVGSVGIGVVTSKTAPWSQSFIGNGGGILVWGVQIEQGSYATSYIPTLSAAVTRGADTCYKTGISSLIGQTEGTIFIDFVYINFTSNGLILVTLTDATPSQAYIYIEGAGNIRFDFIAGGAITGQITTDIGYAVKGTRYKMAFTYKANDFAAYINGQLVGTDNSGAITALSSFYFGYPYSAGYDGPNTMNQALLFKTRLSNSQLAELTTI